MKCYEIRFLDFNQSSHQLQYLQKSFSYFRYEANCCRYWKKHLTLNELLDEIEKIDDVVDIPDDIILFPPADTNHYNTDSGDGDNVVPNNLPGPHLL